MEGKGCGSGTGSWCMLRCAGGAHDRMGIDRMMLGFRPIAPKPMTGGSTGSGNLLSDNKNLVISSKRSKRKYVRVRKNNYSYRSRKNKKADHGGCESKDEIVTLQLLPEKEKAVDDSEDSTRRSSSESWWCNIDTGGCTGRENVQVSRTNEGETDMWLGFGGMVRDQTVVVVESWVTVESASGACMEDGRGFGSREDVEIMKNLENDTCPGFVSDGLSYKVMWVNEAYKKMVTMVRKENDVVVSAGSVVVVMVSLVMKVKLPRFFTSLTCRVRVEYTWQNEKYSKIIPCDIWRMECGGFAWRLDVDAALSLGR
ncbi:hypothetical protein CUMW_256550 [Citrus unshiu]|uniref:DUF7950 domain-containing protein n=1 Tax=Citrus unshiu TaxID=55188 RepID=A0A2H5QS57_CITUN|nr:hypothetical protein CUMW_256550 [Citrus unshiu]